MFYKLLKDGSGYSLVEVMASIVILSIAIIPMVGMFDVGLRAATSSGNYDMARMFANERLEHAKNLSYEDATKPEDLKNDFPDGVAVSSCGSGCTQSNDVPATSTGLPAGSTYKVVKQYLEPPPSTGSVSAPFDSSSDGTDKGLMRVTVTVSWNGNTFDTSAVVAK